MAVRMDRPKKIAIAVAFSAVFGANTMSLRKSQVLAETNAMTLTRAPGPCADNDVDEFAHDPTGEWCYIRMYKCADKKYTWEEVHNWGLPNYNTGDLAWGMGGKKLGKMVCAHYGKYLQVWRVAVKRELMIKKPRYKQCNEGVCGCGLDGNCHGKKPAVNFGWRHKGSKRQFSLPAGSRGDQWKDMCLERAVATQCIAKTTYNEDNIASVSAIFQRDVLDKPVRGCESQSKIINCMP